MRMLWKCIVNASNHCEVDRQWLSTHDLFNAIIRLAGLRRPRINGTGVCSNSIESSTNTSRKFAQAWQLVFDVPFRRRCTSTNSPSNPPPAATGGRVHQLVTMMKINTTHQTTALCAPRFRNICDVIYCHLLAATAASEWVRSAIWKSNSKISSII